MFNALMPGEHDWMKNARMSSSATPGYTPPQDDFASLMVSLGGSPSRAPKPSPAQAPQKKNRPILNALGSYLQFAAPEQYEAGRTARMNRDYQNALAGGDMEKAAQYRLQMGDFEGAKQIQDYTTGQADAARKQEAQGVYQLFTSMQPAQINDYAMQDPAGFERMTGMTSEEYLASAQQMQQVGMTPEQFHQYVIGKAQSELGITPETPEPYTLAPGARRYGPDGQLIAENPVAAKPQERWEEYTPPGGIPGLFQRSTATGEIKRVAAPQSGGIRIGADGTVQIGGPVDGLGYGSAPKGEDAAIAFDREGNPIVTPSPQQESYNKAVRGLQEFTAQNAIVVEDIDRALSLASGWSTGAGAALKDLPIVGGITPAGQMESLLSTIEANVGFDKLQAMREASPTGGALGAVTERELAFLQAVFGSLRQDTTEQNVRYNLQRLRDHMVGREQRLREALAADFPSLQTTAERRGAANQQVQDLNDLLEFMTPEERALFEGEQ